MRLEQQQRGDVRARRGARRQRRRVRERRPVRLRRKGRHDAQHALHDFAERKDEQKRVEAEL